MQYFSIYREKNSKSKINNFQKVINMSLKVIIDQNDTIWLIDINKIKLFNEVSK